MTLHPTVPLIRAAARAALLAAETLLPEWLPEGERRGSEWVARNAARGDRSAGSFGVSLASGRWNDFADSQARGGDLVSLLAYLRGCRQIDAAREIDQRLGLGLFTGSKTSPTAAIMVADELRAKVKASQEEEAWRQRRQQEAARRALEIWESARSADRHHPYLVAKQVRPYKVRQIGSRLLVPLYLAGQLVNLQQITPNGEKRFLRGGRVAGCYTPLGQVVGGGRLYICEGWATGATIHADTGAAVACAMNAGNLRRVAKALRAKYGYSVELIIAGDDDRRTAGNPGRTAALEAARAADATVIFPQWPADAPEHLSDFNDLLLWQLGQRAGAALA